jgi:hypothetical protein
MMLLERRGISGAIDDGTVDVMEMVSSEMRVVCDGKYAEKWKKIEGNSWKIFEISLTYPTHFHHRC